jgi:alcohol dehydrogenase (NADP+)
VVGHEIVGEATKVGKDVKSIKVGDIVGVGAQSGSCESCEMCKSDREPYCHKGMVGTYNAKYPDGSPSSGGYADYARVPQHFCIPIPKEVDEAVAAPMMCGGVTVYSPLMQNNVGPGTKVGVVGIGGLGHFAVMFAAALGAEVTAISHTHSKEADAKAMGAKHFIATKDDGAFGGDHKRSLDVIVCTVNAHDMPMSDYLSLLKVGGKLVLVGAPEKPLPLVVFPLLLSNVSIGGSAIGSPKEISEMLKLAAKTNTKTWMKLWKMTDINEALIDMENGNARYRHVLCNEGYYRDA